MNFNKIDENIGHYMNKWGVPMMRFSFALIFFWFGILKTLGMSSVEGLVHSTVQWLPIFSPENWFDIIGWWEMTIGITFLFRKTTRIAIALLFLQMLGTMMPLFLLPEVTFQNGAYPFKPTLEGQYIIKNIMIISAALVVGGSTYIKSSKKG